LRRTRRRTAERAAAATVADLAAEIAVERAARQHRTEAEIAALRPLLTDRDVALLAHVTGNAEPGEWALHLLASNRFAAADHPLAHERRAVPSRLADRGRRRPGRSLGHEPGTAG
jgi:hypothetical protein